MNSSPLRSLLSKSVESDEFGKINTFVAISSGISKLISSTGFQEIYAATISIYPGASYLVGSGILSIGTVS